MKDFMDNNQRIFAQKKILDGHLELRNMGIVLVSQNTRSLNGLPEDVDQNLQRVNVVTTKIVKV